MQAALQQSDPAAIRKEWLQAVRTELRRVREWAEAAGWQVKESREEITEHTLGRYSVPTLEITTDQGQVVFAPVARDVLGARGRIDLSAWPTLYRVMLLRRPDGSWIVRTDSGVNWPRPWGRDAFVELASELAGIR